MTPSEKRYTSRYAGARPPVYLHAPPSALNGTAPYSVPAPVRHGKHVLIVDDDPFFRSLLKVMLVQTGLAFAEISEAEESWTALEICRQEDIDLVFCDLHLTRRRSRNGIEIVSDIRKMRPDLPVYMVTADNAEDVIREVFSSGATGHILKPVNLRILRRILTATFVPSAAAES
jgi:CheY-like chemotaxis protein